MELPFSTRLLFIGLWTIADREGRLEDRPLKIKITVFPADDIDVNMGLAQLETKGFIIRYEVGGQRYIQVTNFVKHQKPHANESGSLISPPLQALAPMVEALTPMVEALGSDCLKDERGKMKEDCLNEECAASPPDAPSGFPEVEWEYPISDLIASFPDTEFLPAQLGHVEAEVKDTPADREAWAETLQLYRRNYDPITNSYLPTKIGTLLSVFKKEKARLTKDGAKAQVGQFSDDYKAPPPSPCGFCGEVYCLSDHSKERAGV